MSKDPLTHIAVGNDTLCGHKGSHVTNADLQGRPTSRRWVVSDRGARRYLLVFGGQASCKRCRKAFHDRNFSYGADK